MATAAKIISIGNSVGVVLPKEVLNHLHVKKGDTVFFTDTPDGIRLTPYDEKLARKLEVMEQVMRENRDVLKRLAE
jgi:putative addiction module antidote